jgi:rhamnosyltransferase
MAHFDHRGDLAPHVRRHVEALAEAVQDLVVVTTADLEPAARTWLSARCRLIERQNLGYDFFSYKVGLDASDLVKYDEVVVCNDSFVGPLVPYADIFATMEARPVDFWGLTANHRVRPHVQSFFAAFRSWTVASRAFTGFWADLQPLSDRSMVINKYEIGLSTSLREAGLEWDSYFNETEDDRRLGRRRVWWWWARRHGLPSSPAELETFRVQGRAGWNPSAGMADRALDHGRLPYVKIDTLRYDPYGLNAAKLLDLCERRFPAAFEGVREFIAETDARYPRRPGETLRPVPLPLRPLRPLVEYRDAS